MNKNKLHNCPIIKDNIKGNINPLPLKKDLSTTKILIYSGNFNIEGSFNLYGYEDIDFNESKISILEAFKRLFEDKIIIALNNIGLSFEGLEYFSPKYYNYDGDSIDLKIKVINKNLLKKAIIQNKVKINNNLFDNKSYDGYMSLTVYDIEEELKNMESIDYEPDIVVLFTILNEMIDFKPFCPYEYLVYLEGEQ